VTKILKKLFFPALIVLAVAASVIAVLVSTGNSSRAASEIPEVAPPTVLAGAEITGLLDEGERDTAKGYFETTSESLVRAAAGDDDGEFYDIGKMLVADGLGSTIINLGREMNGSWYEWSESRAPKSEPDAYILAWRHIVTAMRSVPGQHFKFLWTAYMTPTSVAESWPGSAYVDYIGTDIFDWYGGPDNTYPHTKSGALDHEEKWQQILTAEPGGLNWTAELSQLTGKPIIIPEWGLDFHTFGGQDDLLFVRNMMAWMKAHDAIGLYWAEGHVGTAATVSGPLLVNQGESAMDNTPGTVNAMGDLMGGQLEYAGVYLPDRDWFSYATDQPLLTPWEGTGYKLVLSVPMVNNPPAIKSYSGPPEPGDQPYQLASYPNAVAALRQGAS
jgi:hypothetical protein